MERRVTIQWTETAKEGLKQLPRKLREGLLEKAEGLYDCDPRQAYKPLTGPLQGCYRIPYGRYRAIYRVEKKRIARGGLLVKVLVQFIAVGIRKERDKNDIYRLAQKLADMGFLPMREVDEADNDD
jgi:mRNA-degrading endonuclease RelE of RelBE toxin-antitoxin system